MSATKSTDHETIVSDWRQNAELHDDENYQFLRSLKFQSYGYRPDKVAAQLHDQAFQIVDCTRCANCCKTMEILFSAADIRRISAQLKMSAEKFIETYLEPDDEKLGGYLARSKPCPFLGADDRCTIYDIRPKDCREYPHTNKKDFASRTRGHANNALTCPIVFWIVEQMKRRAKKA